MKILITIFKAANIAEIVLISFMVFIGVYVSIPKITTTVVGFLTLMIIIMLTFSTIANSYNNFSIISAYTGKKEANNIKTIYFWIISILFILSISLRFFATYSAFKYFFRFQGYKKLETKVILMFFGNAIFILNGLFIFCLQSVLFYRIKKKQKESIFQAITQIGENI